MCKVTIIVPVYNIENYIVQCLTSLVEQELNGCEILVVDDGSTDNSYKVVEKFKQNYSNINLIKKKNGGLASARNEGLKYAKGEYVAFIDGDDWINKEFIKDLYNVSKKNDLDICMGSYVKYFEDTKQEQIEVRNEELVEKIMTGAEMLSKQIEIKEFRAEVCDDLYRRTFLEENNIKFYDGLLHEDEEFTTKVLINADKVMMVKRYGYFYRQRQGSIMNSTPAIKNLLDLITISNEFAKMAENESAEKRVLLYKRSFSLLNLVIGKIHLLDNKKQKLVIEQIKKADLKHYIHNANSLTDKVKAILINTNIGLYKTLIELKK